MKILQISHRYHVAGGSDAVFFATSRMLEDAGHEVVPFCLQDARNEPTPWARYFPRGADTGRKSARDTLRYFWNGEGRRNLSRLIRDHGPFDVAHLHIYHGKQTPAILPVLKAAGIPVIQSLHEYKLACPNYTMQRHGTPCDLCIRDGTANALLNRCKSGSVLQSAVMLAEFHAARMFGDVRLVDRFLCVSDFQRRVMKRAGLPADKLRRLHNFVDLSRGPARAQPAGDFLYFGRLEKLKGLPTLIDAAQETGIRLTIAGSGEYEPVLRRQIADSPAIRFVGFKSGMALRQLVRSSRAVIVPSEWYENCPMAVLEAKAEGKPVIGARIGGIPELVRDDTDGFLFEPGNRQRLVAALSKFASHDLEILGRASRQDAETRFSARFHLEQLLAHYRAVMRPKSSAHLVPDRARA